MELTRRTLFRIAGAASAGAAASALAPAAQAALRARPDAKGVLVDTTLCVGCRTCEAACAEANKLPEPERPGDDTIFETRRETGPDSFTVVNKSPKKSPSGDDRFGKKQCLHCIEPACASACAVNALEKTPDGPVTYKANRCLGCRYCMVACPFEIPKYEYAKTVPTVRKCTFCAERQKEGKPPACAENCPMGALTFGKRDELIEEAKKRIYQNPDKYVHRVYGEEEAGGTSWLYISDVPFESLALKTRVQNSSYPARVEGALSTVPWVMTLWPPLLAGLYTFTNRKDAVQSEEETHE
ncbi:MAG: 4Fe-4S dicluster domain-containing protein [Acidobacteria bacterium]|nr:4Fe-4S dicluster domain-containing protein [Acidobacteriota bacterium]MCG3194508.1 Formate dehydrogenase, nitrate-inducible, iron-sulfur subunit [Thermoanaerobaculia bacterium]MCK6685154.1 4Fe-4S dicluster domain-containing protein [Thermoanaerobaculia bacterium]